MSTEPQPETDSPLAASQPLDAERLAPPERGDDPRKGSAPHSPLAEAEPVDTGLVATQIKVGDPVAQGLLAKRRDAIAAGAHLRRDFADQEHWSALAKARGLRLAAWHIGPTPGRMRVFLRKLGISVEAYKQWAGERTLRDFAARNLSAHPFRRPAACNFIPSPRWWPSCPSSTSSSRD